MKKDWNFSVPLQRERNTTPLNGSGSKKQKLESGTARNIETETSLSVSRNSSRYSGKVTRPSPFTFQTDKRLRKTQFMSFDETEDLEMNNLPLFKAKPCPLFKLTATKRPCHRNPLAFREFKLSKGRRKLTVDDDKENTQFRARPLNRKILENPDFQPNLTMQFTTPSEYSFGTTRRTHCLKPTGVPQCVFKAKPMPDFTKAFSLRSPQFVPTVPLGPFLETALRGENHSSLSREEPQFEGFKARPLPEFPAPLAFTHLTPITLPEPFRLHTGSRERTHCHSPFEHQTEFSARPLPSFTRPFTPTRSDKQITSPVLFPLCSTSRSQDRASFNSHRNQQSFERYTQRQLNDQAKSIQDQKSLAQYRESLEFKARKMPKNKPFTVVRGQSQLTTPQSPAFPCRDIEML